MTAKKYLEQVRYVDRAIDSKLEQLYRLKDEATHVTSVMSDMPRSSSPSQQHMEGVIAKIIDLERDINSSIDRLVELKAEATKAIGEMDNPDERLILELRYLCYKSWAEIADKLGYCDSKVFKLHGRALKNFTIPAQNIQ